MTAKRATKTSTLAALRNVNRALRMAVDSIDRTTFGFYGEDGYRSESLNVKQRIQRVDYAADWLRVAEDRIEHARNHLYSYRARLEAQRDPRERGDE